MSFLDLYQTDQAVAARTQPNEATQLPATAEEGFNKAWSDGELFSHSTARENARMSAIDEYIGEIQKNTGKNIGAELDYSASTAGPMLSSALLPQVNAAAQKIGVDPIDDDELDRRAVERSKAAHSDYAAFAAREKTLGGKIGELAGGIASAATDPINLLAMPIAPEAGLGVVATAARFGLIAAGAQTTIELAGQPYREEVQPGYAASGEPLANIAEAGAFGFAFGGAAKMIGNAWTRIKTGEWPRSVRDAGNIAESEANVANTNVYPGTDGEVAHRTSMQSAIDSLVSGKPVDVESNFTPSILAAYEQRLSPVMESRAAAIGAQEAAFGLEREGARLPPTMERLSERQLAGFRDAADEARVGAAQSTEALTEQNTELAGIKTELDQRGQAIESQRGTIDDLRQQAQGAQERANALPETADKATQDRLAAIESDLGKKNLTAARRAALETERDQITETIGGKRAAEISRERASHEQEAAALNKAADREQKVLEKAASKHAKDTEKFEARQAAAAREGETLPTRTAGQVDAARIGLRKSINKLAHEGYDIRLSQDDATAMANSIIDAPDHDAAEAAIRGVTEQLVDLRQEAQRTRPAEAGAAFGESQPITQTKAQAAYHTEQMRKSIQTLAREVGYAMPKDEAAEFAAKLVGLPEDQALRALDEMMLSPREAAEALPGAHGLTPLIVGTESGELPLGPKVAQTGFAGATVKELRPETIAATLVSPQHADAMIADLDRQRMLSDKQIPVGVDEKGEPIFRSLDDMVEEVKADREAADQLEACINPPQQAEAAE